MKIILQIEHPVPDFETWKKEGFDIDPINREKSGVRRYRIMRPVNDPHYVLIELEFDNLKQAEACLVALQKLWHDVMERFSWSIPPVTRFVQIEDSKEY